jgi:hypothetical protein
MKIIQIGTSPGDINWRHLKKRKRAELKDSKPVYGLST